MCEAWVGYERWWNSFAQASLRHAPGDVFQVVDRFERHANQRVAHARANG